MKRKVILIFLQASVEFVHPNDAPEKILLGVEYSFMDMLFLRGGYKMNYGEQSFVVGAGLMYDLYGYMGRLNYAYRDFGDLKNVHMIQLGLSL